MVSKGRVSKTHQKQRSLRQPSAFVADEDDRDHPIPFGGEQMLQMERDRNERDPRKDELSMGRCAPLRGFETRLIPPHLRTFQFVSSRRKTTAILTFFPSAWIALEAKV